ncbi:MAG: plasmid mobilization relaxosome protein MobC, partial [Alphaproteobacteria bacterium]|nr:plasmid mobilization relaxosome protein MobC [Alphaproteobacteria bacterium]
YIRASVLGAGYVSAIDPTKHQLLINIQRELNKQGTNLNQIAKHLNAGILNPFQGKDHLSLLARSLLNAHSSVRLALSESRTME